MHLYELLKKANEIRRTTRKVVFVKNSELKTYKPGTAIVADYQDKNSFTAIFSKSCDDISRKRIKNFQLYVSKLIACFPTGKPVEEEHVISCADKIAELFLLGDCYYEYGNIVVKGKEFGNRSDLFTYLPIMYEENPTLFEDLSEGADTVSYLQSNCAMILDGVAYIAKTQSVYQSKPSKLDGVKIFGYLVNGKIKWVDVDKTAYVDTKTKGGKVIKVLNTIDMSCVDSILRNISVTDFRGIKVHKYPIAILEDGEYTFYLKEAR